MEKNEASDIVEPGLAKPAKQRFSASKSVAPYRTARKSLTPRNKRNKPAPPSQKTGEKLLVFCWCMATCKKLPQEAVALGITFSCGSPTCEPKNYRKGE